MPAVTPFSEPVPGSVPTAPVLRVLQVIKSLGRGGAEMLLLSTQKPLRRLGVECDFAYFLPWKDALVADLERGGGRVHLLTARTNSGVLLASRRLGRLARERGYDLLHAHLPISGVSARIAGRLARTPVVYTEHNLQDRYHPVTQRLNRLTWKWQERVIAVSAGVASSIARQIGATVPVSTVPNGVDTTVYAPDGARAAEARRQLGIQADARVVGSVAVFRPQKRLDRWLEAATILAGANPGIHFVLVGDGPLKDEILERVREMGLRSRFHLPGLCDDVRPFLAAMDVYMISSDFEGLPVAMLEAMSTGVPVVSTDVGGISEAVIDGDSGLLVETPTAGALADAVCRLLDDLAYRTQLARTARRTVSAKFSVERMAGDLAGIYRRVLSEGDVRDVAS